MCGIHFVVNRAGYTYKLDDFMKDAFITNQVRGMDGAGMFQVMDTFNVQTQAKNVGVFKKDMNASAFIGYAAAEEMLRNAARMPLTVGHVRAATAGAVTQTNTHPFIAVREDSSRIVGVHNGSLNAWKGNLGSEEYDVDSQWLFSKLAQDGTEAFEGFDGAFALVWYDSLHPDTMFVARNDKRPLFWCFTEDHSAMMGCSELGMLGWLTDRHGIKLAKDKDGIRFFYPEPGVIHKINLKDLRDVTKEPFAAYNATKRKYAKPVLPNAPVVFGYPAHNAAPAPHASRRPVATAPLGHSGDAWEQANANRQARVFEKVKKALRDARNARADSIVAGDVDDETVITGDMLEDKLAQEINTWLKTRHGMQGLGYVEPLASPLDDTATPQESFTFVAAPNCTTATAEEIKRATSVGIYGLVVQFCGYFFDEETCSVFGDFRTIENGENVVYDAIVRGQSHAAGDAKYINPTNLVEMVVIGVTTKDRANDGKPYIILADKAPNATTTTVYNTDLADVVRH